MTKKEILELEKAIKEVGAQWVPGVFQAKDVVKAYCIGLKEGKRKQRKEVKP